MLGGLRDDLGLVGHWHVVHDIDNADGVKGAGGPTVLHGAMFKVQTLAPRFERGLHGLGSADGRRAGIKPDSGANEPELGAKPQPKPTAAPNIEQRAPGREQRQEHVKRTDVWPEGLHEAQDGGSVAAGWVEGRGLAGEFLGGVGGGVRRGIIKLWERGWHEGLLERGEWQAARGKSHESQDARRNGRG